MKFNEDKMKAVFPDLFKKNHYATEHDLATVINLCEKYVKDEKFRKKHQLFGLCYYFYDVLPSGSAAYPGAFASTIAFLYKLMYGRVPRYSKYISVEDGVTQARINFCKRVVDYFEVKEAA